MRRGTWAGILTCIVALGVAGCWNPFSPDNGNGNGHPIGDRKSPDNLLEFFATAYEDKSIDRYTESVDDSYSFTFMEDDWPAAGVSADRPYWGKTEDVERTQNMFTNADTKAISFDFGLPIMPWYYCPDSIYVEDHWEVVDGFCCIRKPDIKVDVDDSQKGFTTYWVKGSWLEITVIEDRLNAGLWTVLRIRESLEP
jgi:hypothetical protein